MKDKIYIVSWEGTNKAGGVERVTQYLIEALQPVYDVIVVDYELVQRDSVYGKFLKKKKFLDGAIFSCYIRRLQKNDPRAKVIIQGYNCPFVKADIAFAHGTMRGYLIRCFNDRKWNTSSLFEKWGQKKAKSVIAVGGHVKREVVELYGVREDKVQVVENCVDTSVFFPIKHEYPEYYTILFAGRLEETKGLSDLLKLAESIEHRSDFRLVMAANSDTNAELFAEYKKSTVRVGLNKSEMNDFYNSGDIMFFPSHYEGFEMVTTECLSAGVPVIGNNIGAVGDLYERGCRAVSIRSGVLDEDLAEIIRLCRLFRDYDAKLDLHIEMEKKFGIEEYIKKIKGLLVDEI